MNKTKKQKMVSSREIFIIWIVILFLCRLEEYLFPGGIRFTSKDSPWMVVFSEEPVTLLWLSIFTSLSFGAKHKKYFDIFISFVLIIAGSSLFFFGSLYFRIFGMIVGTPPQYILNRAYFLLYTITPLLFYSHYRIMTLPLENNLEDNLFFLKSILNVHSFQQNTKAYYVGTVMWGCTIIMSALLLSYPQTWRPVVSSYSLAFGSAWFVYFGLISLFFRYKIFQSQTIQIYKIVLTFFVTYFIASLFSPDAALSLLSVFNIANELKSNMGGGFHPLWFMFPAFLVLLFYFHTTIQRAK